MLFLFAEFLDGFLNEFDLFSVALLHAIHHLSLLHSAEKVFEKSYNIIVKVKIMFDLMFSKLLFDAWVCNLIVFILLLIHNIYPYF